MSADAKAVAQTAVFVAAENDALGSGDEGTATATATATVHVEPALEAFHRGIGEDERTPFTVSVALLDASTSPVMPASVMAFHGSCDGDEVDRMTENKSNKKHNNPFGQHDKHQLPPAPRGTEWIFQLSSHRWVLRPLVEAEFTILEAEGSTTVGSQQGGREEEAEIPIPPSTATLDHWIQPSDTFPGLCLKYGVNAMQIRRANYGFSGTNLSLAPNPLKIPNIHRAVPESTDRELLVQTMRLAFRGTTGAKEQLPLSEAKCYLALNDWDVARALQNAEGDLHDQDLLMEEKARFDMPPSIIEKVVIDEEL